MSGPARAGASFPLQIQNSIRRQATVDALILVRLMVRNQELIPYFPLLLILSIDLFLRSRTLVAVEPRAQLFFFL